MNSWKDLNDRFYKDKTFGGIMTASTHFLRRELREIVEDSLPDLDKAKKGSLSEINLLLTAMLGPQADLARETLKNPYVFDFLTLGKDAQERDLDGVAMLRDCGVEGDGEQTAQACAGSAEYRHSSMQDAE